MIEPADRPCSSTVVIDTGFEVLGALWLRDTLVRIEHKIDLLLKAIPADFSTEDAQVKAMTERVEEAKERLPKQEN